ncbi:MAG: winged helix-turn-helix domain-containing protein [bacterium]
MQFLDWDFAQDLSGAMHINGGDEIRFTRSERSLIQALMSYKGRIWTRDSLLNAVAGIDSEASDRSIDFIINRLRRKLQDSARQPRYIETRYGEGYVWIAGASPIKPMNHAALPPVRTRLRGSAIMSYCDRPDAERSVLNQHADRVVVLRVQGFLFYGAANRLFEEVRQEIDGALDYLIVDFRDVQGVDDTAVPALVRMERLVRDRGVELMFSSVRAGIENRFTPLNARRFGTLDAAVEWRETQILAADPPAVPTERTLACCLAEDVGEAEAETVLSYFEVFTVSPGSALVRAATETREMFFIERGTAEVVLDVEGTEVRISRIWPGTLFGEIGFHCGYPRTATVRSLEDCRVVCMKPSAVQRLEADFPSLAIALHRFLARRAAERLIFYNDMVVDFFRSTFR